MGSSAKKKREKQKDFQKTKFKVGKAKAKPDNFTDTSFKAKSIVLKKQSLSTDAPTTQAQIAHHTALLKNRSDSQRHDSLAFLTNLPVSDLANAAPELLPKLPPLISDASSSVRQQLLKLFKRLPSPMVASQPDQILAWTRAGMTHLAADVRMFSLEVLEWLLQIAGEDVVSCKGIWMGYLQSFLSVLGWKEAVESKGWSTHQKPGARPGTEVKSKSKQLYALAAFLRAGLSESVSENSTSDETCIRHGLPFLQVEQHGIPRRPNAFAHLNLFGPPADEEQQMYENREDRHRVFQKYFDASIRQGIEQTKKEGGEVGRASAAVQRALDTASSLDTT